MRRRLVLLATGAAASVAVMAGGVNTAAAGNDYCGRSGNGCAHSMANTVCAGHGAFGAFGKDNSLAGGASGERAGFFNATLCGNPQGDAGTLDPTP